MATMTVSKTSHLVKQVERLLNPYEEFTITDNEPGIFGYVLRFKTNVYIHRKHTRKDLFIPHSTFQASTSTALPNIQFMQEWLKNARIAAKKLLDKGEYTAEEKIGGEWQSVKRRYNQYVFYDRTEQRLTGEVQGVVGNVSPPITGKGNK